MLHEVWPFVDAHRRAGRPVVLARLVGRDGPGARPLGATMAVAADGTWRGSLSDRIDNAVSASDAPPRSKPAGAASRCSPGRPSRRRSRCRWVARLPRAATCPTPAARAARIPRSPMRGSWLSTTTASEGLRLCWVIHSSGHARTISAVRLGQVRVAYDNENFGHDEQPLQ